MSGALALLTSRRGFRLAGAPPVAAVASVTVFGSASVAEGATTELSAVVQDADGNVLADRTVTWASDSSHATVNSSGVVGGASVGTANITATCETVESAPHAVEVMAAIPEGLSPGNTSLVAGNGEVVVSWTPPTGGEEPYTFQLYGSTDGSQGTPITGATSSPYTDSELDNGVRVYYTVVATDDAGASVPYDQKSATPSAPVEGAFFTESFASGDLSNTENGFAWGATGLPGQPGGNVSVATDFGRSDSNSLRFAYPAKTDGDDSTCEQRFHLGRQVSEIWLEFYLYIPDGTEGFGSAAYYHRNQSDTIATTTGSMEAGSPNLVVADAVFTEDAEFHWNAVVPGAGAGGATLNSTVKKDTGYVSATEVVLSANASVSVTDVAVTIKPKSSATNNKLFRLWGNMGDRGESYDSSWVKWGAQTWSEENGGNGTPGESRVQTNFTAPKTADPTAHVLFNGANGSGFITAADQGAWMQVRAHAKIASSADAKDGVVEWWKNGELWAQSTGLDFYDPSGAGNYFDIGYLFGAANSGFDELTYLWLDDLSFFDTDPGWV